MVIDTMKKVNKFSIQIQDNFKDIQKFSENSLKEVWGNKEDNFWDNCFIKNKSKGL